jgi:cytoskeletal protein RodZ
MTYESKKKMYTTKKLTVLSIALTLSLTMIGWPSAVTYVSAEKPTNPDLWGKEAEELAQSNKQEEKDDEPGSEMGEHTRDPSPDLNGEDPGRVGVGNVDEALEEATGQEVEDHPSGVVDFLCGEDPETGDPAPDCPDPAPADDDP